MGIYLFKHKRAACNKSERVARYFTDLPNATLQQAAKHFRKSVTWVKNYKDLAIRLGQLER